MTGPEKAKSGEEGGLTYRAAEAGEVWAVPPCVYTTRGASWFCSRVAGAKLRRKLPRERGSMVGYKRVRRRRKVSGRQVE